MARPWYASTWVRIGGVVLSLGLAITLSLPFLIPADRFRPLLVRFIEASTGREVQIDLLRLYLVPTVRLHAVNIRMKNPQGFPRGDAIVIKSVDLGVEPRALLSRRLDVTHIALKAVQVNFLSDASGRTNFDLPTLSRAKPPGRRAAAAGGVPILTLNHIGAVTVTNVDITAAGFEPRRRVITPSFTLRGLSARIRSVDLNAADWLRTLEIAVPLRGARLTTPVLAAPVRFQTGEILVKGGTGRGTFAVSLDTMRAKGTAAIARLDSLPVTFAVNIPQLNVDRLERVVVRGANNAGFAPRVARRLLARGEVRIDRLVRSPLEATGLTSRLSVYTNTVQVDSYALTAYGGTVRGAADLNYSAASLPTAVSATVRGVNLGRLVTAIAPGAKKITGALDADLRLVTALGRDPQASLAGGGTFAIRNGSFPGLDVRSGLAQIARTLLNVPAGETRFSYLGGDLSIARQRVFSNSLRLDGEGLEGTARGSFGFDKTLDYTGTGSLRSMTTGTSPLGALLPSVGQVLGNGPSGSAGAKGVEVPFNLRGTFDDPKFSLASMPQLGTGRGSQERQTQPPQQFLPQDLTKLFQ